MTAFGATLFQRSPFVFWALTPWLLLGALAITLPFHYETGWEIGTVAACDAAVLLLVLGLWPYHPIPHVQRILAGLVATAFALYALHEWLPGGLGPGEAGERRVDSLIGAFVIGLPCMWFALTGRWPGPSPEEPPNVEFDREQVRCIDGVGDEPDTRFAWSAVVRIGFRTTDECFSDHQIEFHLAGGDRYAFPTGWPGVGDLIEAVRALPDARVESERGSLANVVEADSIVVWPSSEAGRSLDA